jgi:hypothetical protein
MLLVAAFLFLLRLRLSAPNAIISRKDADVKDVDDHECVQP